MKTLQNIFGIFLIIGLSLGIGFGFYHQYDGKNLRELAGMVAEMKDKVATAEADARAAQRAAGKAQRELAHYLEYIVGEAP